MGIVIRQSIKSGIVTIVGVVMGGLIALLSMRYFEKVDYGFTQNLNLVGLMISYVGVLGSNFTLMIYGQKYPPDHPARGTFLTVTVIISSLFTLLVIGALWLLKNKIIQSYNTAQDLEMMQRYFWVFPVFVFFQILLLWMEGYLLALNKTAIQTFSREVLIRIIYISLIVLFAFQVIDFSWFIWLYVLFFIIPFLFLYFMSYRTYKIRFEWKKGLIDRKEMTEIFRFSGYHMMMVLSVVLIIQVGAVMLGPLASDGLQTVAVYGISMFVISILRNSVRGVFAAALPTLTRSYNDNRMDELRFQFGRSAITIQVAVIFLTLLVMVNLQGIQGLVHIINPDYHDVHILIFILILGQVSELMTGMSTELISISKFYRFNFWSSLIVLIIIVMLNFLLIKQYGAVGAAVATSSGLFLHSISKVIYIKLKLNMLPYGKDTLKILAIAFISGFFAWLVPVMSHVFTDIILRSFIAGFIFFILIYKLKISPEINEVIKNIILKRKLF